MVILTAKLNKGKLLAALLILAVLIAATILICSGGQPDAAAPADNLRASNNDERVAFLASFGWTVQADPVKMQQVRIPDTASEVFDRYNQLQQSQGFDLAQYAGKTVQQFVYEISNDEPGGAGLCDCPGLQGNDHRGRRLLGGHGRGDARLCQDVSRGSPENSYRIDTDL